MKNKVSDYEITQENKPVITRNIELRRYTEENSPFIKRKMDLARAILSKAPLPDFEDLHKKENVK